MQDGDLVVLKSGGPVMTIGKKDSYGKAVCYWFDDNQKQQSGEFYLASLKKHSPKEEE